MRWQHLFHFVQYLLARTAIAVVQALRIETCHGLARCLAHLAHDVIGLRRKVIEENLEHAFPHLSAETRDCLARQSWEHLFLMIFEITHTERKIHETNWRRHIRLKNHRLMVEAMLDERPTVLVSGHVGNFEIAGHMTGLFGLKTFTIARPLDNPYLDRFFVRFCQSKGQTILPKKGSAAQIDDSLSSGGILIAMGDQAAGPKGCWVDFFGRPASTHKAIALFSLVNEAPLVVCYGLRTSGPMQFEIGAVGMVDPRHDKPETTGVRELTQWYTDRLEDLIRRDPGQYWWVHRRWKDYGRARKQRKKAA